MNNQCVSTGFTGMTGIVILTMSGESPNPRNCLTLCCVGLVFCSPVLPG